MKYISEKYIDIAILFFMLFFITLIAGIFSLYFLIFSLVFLIAYIVLDKKKLRCPKCGGFENLDRLINSKKYSNYCTHCGEKINIKK